MELFDSAEYENCAARGTPESLLASVFGYPAFRPLQREIIGCVLERRDTLAVLSTGIGRDAYIDTLRMVRAGNIKLLYLSPEALATDRIRELLTVSRVDCIAVDEAHCISEWGHDFRPDYRAIAQILEFLRDHEQESGIIYCFSRRQVDELTAELCSAHLAALPYHAGLDDKLRARNQQRFIQGDIKIMVATVAFGMGIDKADVRFVIHYDMPKSLEQYYQEIGRAGRDGKPAQALLLYSSADIHKIRYFMQDMNDGRKAAAERLVQGMISYAESKSCRSGRELSKNEWCELARFLLAQRLIKKSPDYGVLSLTRRGYAVCAGTERVSIAQSAFSREPHHSPAAKQRAVLHKRRNRKLASPS